MIVFKCERAGCSSIHPYSPNLSHAMYDQLPVTWVSYFAGRARDAEGYIFCSLECLKKHLGVTEPTRQPLEQPASKMRRFLLVDEDAEEIEGIVWGHGQVSLNGSSSHIMNFHCQGNFLNWEMFKAAHEGCGVTWIDQEVKKEEMSHA